MTEVVWETDGVEEIPERKPALAPEKASAPPVASKMPAERYYLVFCSVVQVICKFSEIAFAEASCS